MSRIILLCGLLALWGFLPAQTYQDYVGNGHYQGVRVQTSADGQMTSDAHITLDGLQGTEQVLLGDASRFLAQATFGANLAEIERTATIGFEAWINEQLAIQPSYTFANMEQVARVIRVIGAQEEGEEVPDFEEDEIVCEYFPDFRSGWWHTIMTAEDQLRQRVAFALSEILVVSETSDALEDACDGLASYYDLLIKHAFGNYRDLLYDVSMSTVMGFYLSHYNNPKTDTANNIHPDENYAREIMQLFSIGLYELNLDGSRKLDGSGQPIPTYTNTDIKEYAKVFTGLGPGAFSEAFLEEVEFEEPYFGAFFPAADHRVPMKMYEAEHEPGPKNLLRGEVIPAGQSGMQDINMAIDNLFNHPNVGPFISRLLIQRLVTSNPTPDYIARVANVFNNNGKGVRGDLGAVVKAILMDVEARECGNRQENIHRAMLREPLIRYTHFYRALEVQPVRGLDYHVNFGFRFDYRTGQMVLSSPSVFNFFLPDYQPSGLISDLNLYGPEFQIHNSSTSIAMVNEINDWTFTQALVNFYDPRDGLEAGADEQEEGESVAYYDIATLENLAENPTAFLNRLDLLFTHGQLSTPSRKIMLDALQAIEDPYERVLLGLYLMMLSPDYAVLN